MFASAYQQAIARHLQSLCRRTAFGGDCFNYACLASGWSAMPMVILEADMNYYDFCALIPIIEGSGGKISDWQGNPLHAEAREVLATSNATLHKRAIAAIGAARSLG